MSKKVLSIGLSIAGLALFAVPGIGAALGIGAKLLVAGLTASQLIGAGLMVASNFLLGPSKPKALKTAPSERLFASLDPTAPRKIVFGHTAMATDVRYQAFTGSKQEYLEQIICVASHAVEAIEELWLDNEQAWTVGGGAQGRYAGYLTVTARLEGNSGNGIAIDGNWTTACTLTGCAYIHLKAKLTGNSSTAESPFSGGVTSRMTIRGKGAKVYDPRLDDTVEGGSGDHRADDQATWEWDDDASRNSALQELFYELGWRINDKLAVGKGVPPSRLNLPSYATAANVCDESVTLNGGGSEPRYRSDGVISEGDSPGAVRDTFCANMNAVLRDAGGKLALTVLKNDLGSPVTPSGKSAFDENDVLGEMRWEQTPALADTFNIVRGRRVDPSDRALYQLTEYPAATLANTDGIDRIDTFDLPMCQSNGQAQRLAKQRLQRNQYQGRLSFTGGPAFWGISLGDVFPLTHATFGWSAKLFRCAGHKMSRGGAVEIVAVEENAAIYAWDNDEAAAVGAGEPVVYDPLNSPLLRAIGNVPSASFNQPDAPRADESAPDVVWLDSDDGYKAHTRVAGTGYLEDGDGNPILDSDGEPIEAAWIAADDQRIMEAYDIALAAIDRLDDLDDDGIITIREKIERLIPDSAALESAWGVLDALADDLGVTTERTAAADARTDWLDLLASLSPAWNDTTQDTPVTRADYDDTLLAYRDALNALQLAVSEAQGIYRDIKWKRSWSQPATPTGSNPAGWLEALDPGPEPGWFIVALKRRGTDAVIGVWSTPAASSPGAARAYSATETYYLTNLVLFNGGTYVATQNNFSGHAPSGDANANAYWDVYAAPGATGAPATPPSAFSATIDLTSGSAVNLRTVANANGYTGNSDATVTFRVPNGVTIRGLAGAPGGIGIDTGTWPSGYTIALTLVVQSGGVVDGGGGHGGAGGDYGVGAPGAAGGDAIYCRVALSGGITIDSGGTVRGGGGGGGGGGRSGASPAPGEPGYAGGSGGGGGAPNGSGGAAGVGDQASGSAGSSGTTGGGGAGGTAYADGGAGGTFAANGSSGQTGSSDAYASGSAGGAGGVGGYAVRKNGFTVSVTNNGTMTGSAA